MCPGVAVGGTFSIGGITYTKVSQSKLGKMANKGFQKKWNRLPTVCTTGITSMSGLFK